MKTVTKKSEIREALEVLEALERSDRRLEKECLLKEVVNNNVFRTLITMSIGPDRYHIRPSEDLRAVASTKLKITQAYDQFLILAEHLRTREITGNKANARVMKFLVSLYPVPKKWFTRVLNKNLRIGVGERTLGTVWGKEAHALGDDSRIEFHRNKCSLAVKLEDIAKKKTWKGIDFGEWGWYSEAKLDGDRALLFWFPIDEQIIVLTRGGKRWKHIEACEEFVGRIRDLHKKVSSFIEFGESTPILYDGEFIARSGSWNETASIIRSYKNFDEEKFLSQVRVLLWDWCPLHYFNQGEFPLPLKDRKFILLKAAGVKKRTSKFTKIVEGVYIVGHTIVYDEKDMWADNARKLARNFEGSMLKNPEAPMRMKRTPDIIKIKPVDQDTGIIIKCVGGKGKHAAAKKVDFIKINKEMYQWGDIKNDGYYLHCDCGVQKVKELIQTLRRIVNDSNDRRVSCHEDEDTVSYRYSERLGYFVVKTDKMGERIRVGGKMKHKAGEDQRMEYWRRRKELVGVKVDFRYQGGRENVAKASFNTFYRLREDLL